MNFKKLALATAIAAVPVAGFSLEAIEDETLSGMTGQDGIELELVLAAAGIVTDIYIHDQDGINSAASTMFTSYSYDGAIVIDNLSVLAGSGGTIAISIDAGDNAISAGAPVLNVNIALPNVLTIVTGDLRVANSLRDETGSSFGIGTQSGVILNTMTIVLGNTLLNIQLGNEVQTGNIAGTDMMTLSAVISGGIVINSFKLNDATAGANGIGATSIAIKDTGGANLNLALDINAVALGLTVTLDGFGGATGADINIEDLYLGSTTAGTIGDVAIVGLELNGALLRVSGK